MSHPKHNFKGFLVKVSKYGGATKWKCNACLKSNEQNKNWARLFNHKTEKTTFKVTEMCVITFLLIYFLLLAIVTSLCCYQFITSKVILLITCRRHSSTEALSSQSCRMAAMSNIPCLNTVEHKWLIKPRLPAMFRLVLEIIWLRDFQNILHEVDWPRFMRQPVWTTTDQ